MSQNTLTPDRAVELLKRQFHIDVSRETAEEAIAKLGEYEEGTFETLQLCYKRKGSTYILLAVQNHVMHNGAWQRYIDHLKANYDTIVVETIVNISLMQWFLRNGFTQTKKHKDWAIWRKI